MSRKKVETEIEVDIEVLVIKNQRGIQRRNSMAWERPEWFAESWIAMDANGEWFAYEHEPVWDKGTGEWVQSSAGRVCYLERNQRALALKFPKIRLDEFGESKANNPHP